MANKLVAVQIKQQNGKYSPEIPVGALAENVAYNSTLSVKQKLDNLTTDFESISEDIMEAISDWVADNVEIWDPSGTPVSLPLDETLTADSLPPKSSAVPHLIAINEEEPIQGAKLKIDTLGPDEDYLEVLTPEDIDGTLSIEGAAADAKATGNAVDNLKESLFTFSEIDLNAEDKYAYIITGGGLWSEQDGSSKAYCNIIPIPDTVINIILTTQVDNSWVAFLKKRNPVNQNPVDFSTNYNERKQVPINGSLSIDVESDMHYLYVLRSTIAGIDTTPIVTFRHMQTDKSLSKSFVPADAKTVGTALEQTDHALEMGIRWLSSSQVSNIPDGGILEITPGSYFVASGAAIRRIFGDNANIPIELSNTTSYNVRTWYYGTESTVLYEILRTTGTEHWLGRYNKTDFQWYDVSLPRKTLKILAIGNSFTYSTLGYLPQVMAAMSPDIDFTIGICYDSGESIAGHIQKMTNPTSSNPETYAQYSLWKFGASQWTNSANNKTLKWALLSDEWDYIILQEAPTSVTGQANDTDDLETLANLIMTYMAENNVSHPFSFLYNLPQCYGPNYSGLTTYCTNHNIMGTNNEEKSNNVMEYLTAYAERALKTPYISDVLPGGMAVQNARQIDAFKIIGATGYLYLTNDNIGHLQNGFGPLIAGYANVMKLLELMGEKIPTFFIPFIPTNEWLNSSGLYTRSLHGAINEAANTSENFIKAQQCALMACKNDVKKINLLNKITTNKNDINELKESLYKTETIDFTNIVESEWIISKTTELWQQQNTPSKQARGSIIQIPENVISISITGTENTSAVAALATRDYHDSTDKHVDWANGYEHRINLAAGETQTIQTNNTTRFLFVVRKNSSEQNMTPTVIFTKMKTNKVEFTVEQGRWNGEGNTIITNSAIKTATLIETTPGMVMDVIITDPSWVYYARQGNDPTNLITTDRLSNSDTLIIKGKYLALAFYRLIDGELINVSVDDWHEQIQFISHGNAIRYYSPTNYLTFAVEQGRWVPGGSIYRITTIAICSTELLEVVPGTVLNVTITEPNWVYTVFQGDIPTQLVQTDRLSNSDKLIIKNKYVGFVFYKNIDGTLVDINPNEWCNQVQFISPGYAIHQDEKNNDALEFIVTNGRWQTDGTITTNNPNNCVATSTLLELLPGSQINVNILEDGWVYTVFQGSSPTSLVRTDHLSNYNTLFIRQKYVGIVFYKYGIDKKFIPITIDDWKDQIIFLNRGVGAPSLIHDLPENEGQMNVVSRAYQMAKIRYKTAANLPVNFNYWAESQGNYYVPTNTELDGIIYSSVREESSYVPQAVSFHTYMTALQNPNSYIYTRISEVPNSKTYYGAVCSSFVAYCYGIDDVIPTTAVFPTYPGFESLGNTSPQNFKIGDMLNSPENPNHIVIITDIMRNQRGKVVYIEITQETSGLDRGRVTSKIFTLDSLYSTYLNTTYSPYRYTNIANVPYTPTPWVNIDETERDAPTYNSNLSPRRGDRANWRPEKYIGEQYIPAEDIEIDVLDAEDYTDYMVFRHNDVLNDWVLFETKLIPQNNLIQITGENVNVGQYRVCLTDGENRSGYVYFSKMDENNSYEYLGNNQVKVTFSSALADSIPSSISWCDNHSDDYYYKSVLDFYILTETDINNGYAILAVPLDRKNPKNPEKTCGKSADGKWLIHVNYKTPFGLYSSNMVEVKVTT